VILWYVVLLLLGVAVLPLVTLVCARLPDRGYALARPAGLLLTSYALWLLATLGIVQNGRAVAAGIAVAIGIATWIGLRRHVPSMLTILSARARYVVGVEFLFALAFAGWCFVRSLMPDITATEKPMELAFLNASIRNSTYPPMDPWLSGFSISYYYFGYVMASLLCQLTGVPSSIGFNLMIAMLFALTVTGAFSVAYNLVRSSLGTTDSAGQSRPALLTGLVAAAFTVLLGNLTGALELVHAHGLGSAQFWAWIGIKDLNHPYVSGLWRPSEPPDTWWWFRSSRVVATYLPGGGNPDYTINEFPFFSFLLADLHPHVLALPFAFVALSLALSAALGGIKTAPWPSVTGSWHPLSWAWDRARVLAISPLRWLREEPLSALSVGLVIGGLGFLNAWDLPTYLFVLVVGFVIGRAREAGRPLASAIVDALRIGWCGGVVAVVLFLPFYVGFRSQFAGLGIVAYRSQLHHFLIFWGPLLFLAVTFAVLAWRLLVSRQPSRSRGWRRAWRIVLLLSFALLALRASPIGDAMETWLSRYAQAFADTLGVRTQAPVHVPVQAPVLALLLPLLMLAIETGVGALHVAASSPAIAGVRSTGRSIPRGNTDATTLPIGATFALALIGTAVLLLVGTELFYIRDLFNNRMNTVFKLYYQAWVLLAVGSAYGVYFVASRWIRSATAALGLVGRFAWVIVAVLLVVAASVYAPAALESRADSFSDSPTLDGTAYMQRLAPDDYAAIKWLWANVSGRPVLVEATGGSYSQYGRISVHTGMPTILGWGGHEEQWRGSREGQDKRRADIETIYRSGNRSLVLDVLKLYDVTYVFVGPLEVETYGRPSRAGIDALSSFLDVAYRSGTATIYKVRR
jgi:YYY domain-containing protein